MSLLRQFRLKSNHNRKSETPELNRKNSENSFKNENGGAGGKTTAIERSDTFTIKNLSPDKEIDESHLNFNTFTRKKSPGNDKIRTDVFDAFYIRRSQEKHHDRPISKYHEDDEFHHDHHYDRHDHPHDNSDHLSDHRQNNNKHSLFDGSTYRKSKISRNDTFTKKPSPTRQYLFGEKRDDRHDSDDDIDYESRNKINNVMTWFVDIKSPQEKSQQHQSTTKISETKFLDYPNENYRGSPILKPKAAPRSSIVKRTDTFKVNKPIQVEIERKTSFKTPIRIEIRNPPLSERNRENEILRPVGVAMPYYNSRRGTTTTTTTTNNNNLENKIQRSTIENRSQQQQQQNSTVSKTAIPRLNKKSKNDITTNKINYDTYSKSKLNSMKNKNNNNNKDNNNMTSSYYQNLDEISDAEYTPNRFNKVQTFWTKRESNSPPSLPPRPIPSNDLLSRYHNMRKEEKQSTLSRYNNNNNNSTSNYTRKNDSIPAPTTLPSTSKPKKLQQFWSSLNNRVQPKKRTNTLNSNFNDDQSRYTYTSQAILKQQQREIKEQEKLQQQQLKKQQQQSRKSNPTSSTLSWLMKVKSKKN